MTQDKKYRIRQANRTLRTGESWVVAEVGRHTIWSVAIWTYSRESAEAIRAALVEGREFGSELYF